MLHFVGSPVLICDQVTIIAMATRPGHWPNSAFSAIMKFQVKFTKTNAVDQMDANF